MELYEKLEFNRLIKELDFIDSDLVYKSTLMKLADENFIKDVNQVLVNFPQLKQILDEKNANRLAGLPLQNHKTEEIMEEVIEEDITTESKNSKLKNLYREIAKTTHPDKNKNDSLKEVYLNAQQAYESNDLVQILSICENLKISYEITNEDFSLIKQEIETKKRRIQFLESTYTWKWYQTESDSQKNQIILNYLETQISR